jgi:putative flavoprotein involved in K+ transport
VTVTAVSGEGDTFVVETDSGHYQARNVVVATGAFQKPRIPSYAADIVPHIHQVHSSQYRRPDDLPPGAVLVVGSGQSGCQIAEELHQSGRQVYLCTGRAGRVPRRYRGREIFYWIDDIGGFDQTVDTLESLSERFAANPQLTGKDGGKAMNLHQFAQDGIRLLGRLQGAQGTRIEIAPDLKDNLAAVDQMEAEIKKAIDRYIDANSLGTPEEAPAPALRAGYDADIITTLDLNDAGITSIIWAAGYRVDFSWIQFPIFDAYGYPDHERGVTAKPGLYFVGLMWLHKSKSNLFLGMGEDTEYIAAHLAERQPTVMR